MILFIDNFDSFTYNLVQEFSALGQKVLIIRNNQITIEQCLSLCPSFIVIGPGPKRPSDAGICKQLISYFADKIPILGICLGHQAIAEVFGGKIIKIPPMHGKTSVMIHDKKGLFHNIRQGVSMMRYHSLAIDFNTIPKSLKVTCVSEDDKQIMAISHIKYPIHGIQFHPESFLSKNGDRILRNFIFNMKGPL